MGKFAIVLITSLLFVSTSRPDKFKGLPPVEAYEIRPGILMLPVYSDTGEVCRIVLETRHVSWKQVDLDPEMPQEEISRIFDELVPKAERGQPERGHEGTISMGDGGTLETLAIYENVSLRMYGTSNEHQPKRYVAATIDWKKRSCRGRHSDR